MNGEKTKPKLKRTKGINVNFFSIISYYSAALTVVILQLFGAPTINQIDYIWSKSNQSKNHKPWRFWMRISFSQTRPCWVKTPHKYIISRRPGSAIKNYFVRTSGRAFAYDTPRGEYGPRRPYNSTARAHNIHRMKNLRALVHNFFHPSHTRSLT